MSNDPELVEGKLVLFADGGSRGNPGPAAAGAVLRDSAGETVAEIERFLGSRVTNNQAEYAAVVFGCAKAVALGATELSIFLDSKLIVEQLSGRWKIKNLELRIAAEKVHAQLTLLKKWKISHIPRAENRAADRLVNRILAARGFPKSTFSWPQL